MPYDGSTYYQQAWGMPADQSLKEHKSGQGH